MCETAAYRRHDISDCARQIIDPKLPGGPGKVGRPAQDSRRFSSAVLRVLRTGASAVGDAQRRGAGVDGEAARKVGRVGLTGALAWSWWCACAMAGGSG